jgi:16S rRNA (guanine527-N7)-methyltransferase
MDENYERATLSEYFGDAFPAVDRFAHELSVQGELRGLIGPREIGRIWDRHILNSAAVVQYLPQTGTIVDIGSGAGLPGLVIAAMRPEAEVILIEPMERRCTWLNEMTETLGLTNVEVKRGRAEEFHDAFEADVVTARAVAALDKLARWSLPLLRHGGELIILKGRNVEAEIEPARKVLKKFKVSPPEILQAHTIDGAEGTTVLRSTRGKK